MFVLRPLLLAAQATGSGPRPEAKSLAKAGALVAAMPLEENYTLQYKH